MIKGPNVVMPPLGTLECCQQLSLGDTFYQDHLTRLRTSMQTRTMTLGLAMLLSHGPISILGFQHPAGSFVVSRWTVACLLLPGT